MNKEDLFNVPKEQQIITNDERKSKLMQFFAVDNFIKHATNKDKFVKYIENLFKNGVPVDSIVEFVKNIDALEFTSLGSMYITKQQDNSIVIYFYQTDSSYIIGAKYGI